ncbi:hypothetical protein [Flagellimonas sp. 2504JD1-5]
MKGFIDKILTIEKKLSEEIGPFNLFALFEREDLMGKYDIVISLDLKDYKRNEIFGKIHSELKKTLSNVELLTFSRFLYLEPEHPFVLNINMAIKAEHSSAEIKNSVFNNVKIYHAFILSSIKK